MTNSPSTNVTGVLVEHLFGLYDYALGSYSGGKAFESSLTVLYGENGCGKTTLLRLVYHLLSKEQKAGHRTALARIPVRRCQVQLADGSEVGLERDGKSLKGRYRYYVRRPQAPEQSCEAILDQTGAVIPAPDPESQAHWAATMEALTSLDVALYYLTDNRRPESERADETETDARTQTYQLVIDDLVTSSVARQGTTRPPSVLETAISDLQALVRDETLRAAGVGEANINSIYAEIARRVLASKGVPVSASAAQARDLTKALGDLMERSRQFSRFGLYTPLDLRELIELSNRARATTRRFLASVLQPYLESVTARLEALGPTQRLLDVFLGSVNSFYAQKHVDFDLNQGLRILQPDGTRLSPGALSSGEQQLLLLFCNTVRARAQATIFIIDEPELSLNVKWQRRLIDSLLQLVSGSAVQFILATHSIELLARHRHAVVRLGPAASPQIA
jgi:energy-coupling factor transporter ATP-binding protein EcfA2